MNIRTVENAFLWTSKCKENQKTKRKTYLVWCASFTIGALAGFYICDVARDQIVWNYLVQVQMLVP